MRFKTLFLTLAVSLAFPVVSEAAFCLGKKSSTRSGVVKLKRGENVTMRTGKVISGGDNRICSTGNVKVILGKKGFNNQVRLGSGNDTVLITAKAVRNMIRTGAGNDRVVIKAKAKTNLIMTGPGDDQVTANRKSFSMNVNTGSGDDQVTLSGKAGKQKVLTGPGDDRIYLKPGAVTRKRVIRAGLGDDHVKVEAQGFTDARVSEPANPDRVSDIDVYLGGPGNDKVKDWWGGGEQMNLLKGGQGFDQIFSLGQARSEIRGGDGTDHLYSAAAGGGHDIILGERGNDKMFSDQAPPGTTVYGAHMDGGEGDDWYYGGEGTDTIFAFSGIKKISGGGGDDLIIRNGIGTMKVQGGAGQDTLSYSAHTPPGAYGIDGVRIDLDSGVAINGKGKDGITGIEQVIGSPYDDQITGSRSTSRIEAGMGDDHVNTIGGTSVDGGQGVNDCQGGKQIRCGQDSPGNTKLIAVETPSDGTITIKGTRHGENIDVNRVQDRVKISTSREITAFDGCEQTSDTAVVCRAEGLSVVSTDLGQGNDRFTATGAFHDWNLIVEGSEGYDTVNGSVGREIIYGIEEARTNDGEDMLWMSRGAKLYGGKGSDTTRIKNPCEGGFVSGGSGSRDGVVFAGASRGIHASFRTLTARYVAGPCANPVRMDSTWEGFEGSSHNDVLIGYTNKKSSFLGREGTDTFNSRNGIQDTITVGGNGKQNKVIADPFDKITWDWGFAAF